MQNIYITECFKVSYDATVASSLSIEQWDTAKKQGVFGHSPGEPGTEFCNYIISPEQTEIMLSLHDPQIQMDLLPYCEKYV